MQHFVAKTHDQDEHWFIICSVIAHTAAVKKGFYDDAPPIEQRAKNYEYLYERSNLISSEIGEAYECYRTGKIKPNDAIFDTVRALMDKDKFAFIAAYTDHIKGTLCEELADVVIRAMDFACSLGEMPTYGGYLTQKNLSANLVFYQLFNAAIDIPRLAETTPCLITTICLQLAKIFDIDIYTNVAMKMAYNEHRPYKHGKNF